MYQSFAADRHALGANLRTTTVMPGQQLSAVLTFDLPKKLRKASTSQSFNIAIQMGADRHLLNGFVGPEGKLPWITYSTGGFERAPSPSAQPHQGGYPTVPTAVAVTDDSSRRHSPTPANLAAAPLPSAQVGSAEPTIEGYRRGEYTQQPEKLLALAKKGFGPAQYELGTLYQEGRGVPRDSTRAVQLYKLAAAHGIRDANTSLGMMYEKGDGVARDKFAAEDYYAVAARQGDVIASTRLVELRSGG
jgi:hypothetical protein